MFKVLILSLLSLWIHYTVGYEVLPPIPVTYWWDIPLLVALMVSWLGSVFWLVYKEI